MKNENITNIIAGFDSEQMKNYSAQDKMLALDTIIFEYATKKGIERKVYRYDGKTNKSKFINDMVDKIQKSGYDLSDVKKYSSSTDTVKNAVKEYEDKKKATTKMALAIRCRRNGFP